SECPICIPARRTLMTGQSPRTHGDRVFQPSLTMPEGVPTLPGVFGGVGYQTFAVGKLHAFPPRDRLGFDDALIAEEGRPHLGAVDDYDIFLADRGYAGQGFAHGMSNNDYGWRTFHLPEDCHVTNWTTAAMCRTIKRRDPTRPALWYLSYTHPHPPIVPLASYLERYTRREMPPALTAPWAEGKEQPHMLASVRAFWQQLGPEALADVRRAFYALCTHIDAQLRLVIGTLREEGVLENTVILITGDHGDMLGDFGLYAKRLMYEGSARVPMILLGAKGDPRVGEGVVDNRPVGLADVMPTLLDLVDIETPGACDGQSMLGPRRETLYCEALEGPRATRMVTDGRHKLIWYPDGNAVQLFDLDSDPQECTDLSAEPACRQHRKRLEAALVASLYGEDTGAVRDGALAGRGPTPVAKVVNRGLSGQRGVHYPQPPVTDPSVVVGAG
ncbi:MAG: sulfatase-like hydrolase/transferase, partial [Pseudomonadota bacterium]